VDIIVSDSSIQVHKFLKDADALLGSIDNLLRDKVHTNAGSDAVPQLGTMREMARRLRERLGLLTQ